MPYPTDLTPEQFKLIEEMLPKKKATRPNICDGGYDGKDFLETTKGYLDQLNR